MADARSFLFWNSVFYIPLRVPHRLPVLHPGAGLSRAWHVRGVFEMFARGLVGFYMVPVFGY